MNTPIKAMDYCIVVSDKKMRGSGLERGDILLISGLKVAPAKKSDPYLQRVYAVAIKINEGLLLVPKDNNEHKAYIVDPRNLAKLPAKEVELLEALMKEQYGDDSTN